MIKLIDKTESIYGTLIVIDTDIKDCLDVKQLKNSKVLIGDISRNTVQAIIIPMDDEVEYKRERRMFTKMYSSAKTVLTDVKDLTECIEYKDLPQFVKYHIQEKVYDSYNPTSRHDDIIFVFLYNSDTKKVLKAYVEDMDNKKDSNYNVMEQLWKEI